jgi:hypothetical protein
VHSKLTNPLAALALLVLFGCSDDATKPAEDRGARAPALPSASTMLFDLDFPAEEQATLSTEEIRSGKPGAATLAAEADRQNWINALVRATYVVLVTYDHLEEPVAAFALAIHSVPQLQDDGSYLWTYIFVDHKTDVEYQIFLYGLEGNASVSWRMEVSTNNPAQPLDHFVWFAGESAKDEHSGYWQFYMPVDQTIGTETARIDWLKQPDERRLTITANGSGLPNEGDVLDFHHTRAQSTIEYSSAGVTSNISWYPDGSGSITVPDYNDGGKACWDTHQRDVACE